MDLPYHIPGLRHTLIQKDLQRREEAPHNRACSLPQAKRTCTTRRIIGRIRASPHSPMHIPGAKNVMGEKTRAKHELWRPQVALQVYSR